MKTLSLTSIALALSVTAASAQDYVQAQIDSLFAQGYTHFSVRRGVLNSSVEAYSSTGLETTVVLNNSTGAVVRQRVETNDATTVAGTIQKIEQKHVDDVDGSDDVLVEVTTATGDTILVEANEISRAPRTGSDDVYTTVTTSTGETAYVEVDDHNYKDDTDHVGGSDDRYGSDNNGYQDRSHDNDDGNDHDGRDDNDDGNDHDGRDDNDDGNDHDGRDDNDDGNDHDDRDDNDDGDDDHGSDHDD